MITTEEYNTFKQIINNTEQPKIFISIDGVIGAGKTTLINLLISKYAEHNIQAHAILEPVDKWMETGVLDYFYSDVKNNAYEFQTYTFITRIQKVIKEVISNPTAQVYLLERTIHTDKNIFVEMLKEEMSELKYNMYNDWWHLHQHLLPIKINKWIVLDTSLQTSLNRICIRNRTEESGISETYQSNLRNKHHEFVNSLRNNGERVIVINSDLMDDNFIENVNVLNNIYNLIIE
jgi:deoxyadenosine/deoxycytidine kinase